MPDNGRVLRIGLIGCGEIAHYHLRAIRDLCGPVAIALCDVSPPVANSLAAAFTVQGTTYSDYRAMIAKCAPDVVHVLTPPCCHETQALYALEQGAHVYIEKPVVLNVSATRHLIDVANRQNRSLCAGHSLLYMPVVRRALAILSGGDLGSAIMAFCFFGHAEKRRTIPYGGVSHWSYDMPGGPLANTVSHPASVLAAVLGRAPQRVTVDVLARNVMPGALGDMARITLVADGIMTVGIVSMAHGNAERYLLIECERGSILVDLARQLLIVKRKGRLAFVSKALGGFGVGMSFLYQTARTALSVATGALQPNPGTRLLVAAFYESIRRQTASPVSQKNVLAVADVVEQVARCQQGKPDTGASHRHTVEVEQ